MLAEARTRVVVITPTIGHRLLPRALSSVQAQTHRHIQHWVVVDGVEFEPAVRKSLDDVARAGSAPTVLVLPRRTGMHGWNGHRIYASVPFLVESDFICFLDQDNWLDPDHVESLLQLALSKASPAAYSLRKIYTPGGELACMDDCESLGPLHECYQGRGRKHVDTNCWIVTRGLAMSLATDWLQRFTGDRTFAAAVLERYPNLPCTRKYSVNYTAESTRASVTVDHFLKGNAAMHQRFPAGLPWHTPASG